MKRLLLSLIALCLLSLSAEAANRFAVCATNCTWDGVSTAMWSTTTGGATGASVPGSADAVILDGATCVGGTTCTITVNTNPTILSLTMGACTASTTGCILDFSANNNNVTIGSSSTSGSFSGTGTGTRTLRMGSGTWTVIGTGTIWTLATVTNLTFTPGGSNLIFQISSVANGGMATANGTVYGHVTINGFLSNAQAGIFTFPNNTFTIGTLDILGPNLIAFPLSPTALTITNPVHWAATGSAPIRLGPFSPTTKGLVNLTGGGTMSFATIYNMGWTGAPTATNSMDQGLNSGITITGPGSGGGCILGGWLLWRDFKQDLNDNFPAWLDKAA